MKKFIYILCFLFIGFNSYSQSKKSSDVYVKGYVKKNGTVVPGHYRSAPNSTNRDNFSTKGNTNPYTNKKGWVDPDNKSYYYSSESYNTGSRNSTKINNPNFSNPLSNQAENYFYALSKRYIGLPSVKLGNGREYLYWDFSEKGGMVFSTNKGYSKKIKMNFGIEVDGGVLIQLEFNGCSECLRGGTLIFYLKNGNAIKCFDRNIFESINGTIFRYYKLTRAEVHLLENVGIDIIDLIAKPDTQGYKPSYETIRFTYNLFNEKPQTLIKDEPISDYLSDFFKPYWEKRD